MLKSIRHILKTPARYHFWGSLAIVIFSSSVISSQVVDRQGFANGELYEDVMSRWGTPIVQPAPSVRYVSSGTVFNSLKPLGFESQRVEVDATMNYRKRGLVYFSGFDFSFSGRYIVGNPEDRDIDIAFVFPVSLDRNKVLLSELEFFVNDKPSKVSLSEEGSKIVWTGRIQKSEKLNFTVVFKGRGLDSFEYRLDPAMSAKKFSFDLRVRGGDNYDYPYGVVPAHTASQNEDLIELHWRYPSLESGVPVGGILPSEKSFDTMISTMTRRSWAPFAVLFLALVFLAAIYTRKFRIYESYLIASAYSLFFVLLAYLAAFTSFYLAYILSAALIGILITVYCGILIPKSPWRNIAGILLALLVVPSLAVVAEGYTGLIYTLEIFIGLGALMYVSTRRGFNTIFQNLSHEVEESSNV